MQTWICILTNAGSSSAPFSKQIYWLCLLLHSVVVCEWLHLSVCLYTWSWLAWWEQIYPLRPTTVWAGWCTCTTAPSCSRGPSSRSAPPQTCRAWCCRWKAEWSSCGPLLFWPELARPWQEYTHIHMYTLTDRWHRASLKISTLSSVSYKLPQVVPTLLQILFDSAQYSSGGHVSIYAEWTGLCTYSKVHTELENEKETYKKVSAGCGKNVVSS